QPLGDHTRRDERAPVDERSGRQSGSVLGARRTPSRVPVESLGPMAGVHDAARWDGDDTDHDGRGGVHKSRMVAAPAVIALVAEPRAFRAETQGGIMLTRAAHITMMSLLLAGLMITGCAKRPATTAATAAAPAPAPRAATPAPTPSPSAPSSGAAAPGATAAAPAQTPRPSPREFM